MPRFQSIPIEEEDIRSTYESGDIDRRLPQIGVIIPCSRLFFIFGLILLLPMKLNQKNNNKFFS